MKITVLRNDRQVPPGHLERVILAQGHEFDLVRLDEGEALPQLSELDAVVVLGGEMGAYDEDRHPYLAEEKVFLRAVVDAGIPVLGVCLGCQLLAESLGGSAYLADKPEVLLAPLECDVEDGVVGMLASGPTLTIHRDTWDPPPGAIVIGRTDRYNQAFRFGSALGVQPHPEVDEGIVESWLSTEKGQRLAASAGADASDVLEAFRLVTREVEELADAFFGAWLAEAEERVLSAS